MEWFLVLSVYLNGELGNEFSKKVASLEECQQQLAHVTLELEQWLAVTKRGAGQGLHVANRWSCRNFPAVEFECESSSDQRCDNTEDRRRMRLEPGWLETLLSADLA